MAVPVAVTVLLAWLAVVRGLVARANPRAVSTLCERCYRPFERRALGEPVCRCGR